MYTRVQIQYTPINPFIWFRST